VVKRVDGTLVTARRFIENGLVRYIPGGVFETPAAKAFVLPTMAPPTPGGGHVDPRAGSVHEFEVALVERSSGGELGCSWRSEPVVSRVRKVHEAGGSGRRDRLEQGFELGNGVGVIDHHDFAGVLN